MAGLQTVRGTHDLVGEELKKHQFIEETIEKVVQTYGFSGLITPIFEFTDVFARSLGETTDVVTKEMYSFTDKGGESLTLRPEGTAGVVRAFISLGLQQNLPVKAFYKGPMFRYERPQKGRQRQFHQVGIELLGVDQPQGDVEVLLAGVDFLSAIGIYDKVKLEINSLGDKESRDNYKEKLISYLKKYETSLSEDSKNRLEKNPLRVLDSKDDKDRDIVLNAPLFSDSLNDESKKFFDEVLSSLTDLGVKYELNQRLVRGLDYYSHTAFEFTTTELGSQGTVLGGGRYNGLVKQMGGSDVSGIGWAAGVERLAMMIADYPQDIRPITVVPMGSEAQKIAMRISWDLRKSGINVDMGYSGNLGKRLKRANKVNAGFAVMIGEDELAKKVCLVRNLDNGEQEEVSLDSIVAFFENRR
ncbi:MAG: histidine--tRNA ligase [Alphaproteobacteria bacterium]